MNTNNRHELIVKTLGAKIFSLITYGEGSGFDPDEFDIVAVNKELGS